MTQEKSEWEDKPELKTGTTAEARATLAVLIEHFFTKTHYIGSTEMNTVFRGFALLLDYFKHEKDEEMVKRIEAIEAKLAELAAAAGGKEAI